MEEFLKRIEEEIDRIPDRVHYGRVSAVSGMLVEVRGLTQTVAIGGQCMVTTTTGQGLLGEVVGFRDGRALLMPFGKLEGIGLGCRVTVLGEPPTISPSSGWLGRVVDALGNPLDGTGPLPLGILPTPL